MDNDLETWRTITLGAAALGQTCFALLYLTFPWWRTFLGRALFYKAAMLAALTSMAFLSRYYGFARNDELFVWLYAFLAFGIWWQFAAFLRVKRQSKQYSGPERRGPREGGLL